MTFLRVAAHFTAYGLAALFGACLSLYGLLAAAERLVKPYPTKT